MLDTWRPALHPFLFDARLESEWHIRFHLIVIETKYQTLSLRTRSNRRCVPRTKFPWLLKHTCTGTGVKACALLSVFGAIKNTESIFKLRYGQNFSSWYDKEVRGSDLNRIQRRRDACYTCRRLVVAVTLFFFSLSGIKKWVLHFFISCLDYIFDYTRPCVSDKR